MNIRKQKKYLTVAVLMTCFGLQNCAIDPDIDTTFYSHQPPTIQTDFALTHTIPAEGDVNVETSQDDPTKIHLKFSKAINIEHFQQSYQVFEKIIGDEEKNITDKVTCCTLSSDKKEVTLNLLGTELHPSAKYTLTVSQTLTSVEPPFANIPTPIKLEFATGGGFDDDNLGNIDPTTPPYLVQARYFKMCNPQGSATASTGVIELRFNEDIQSATPLLNIVNNKDTKIKAYGNLEPVVYNDGRRDLKTWVMGAQVAPWIFHHWIKIDPNEFFDFSGDRFIGDTHIKLVLQNPLDCIVSLSTSP